ncbi:MAG: hypothetical protein QXS48_03575 [Candidatus Aenigmatarchaeota archaeon]
MYKIRIYKVSKEKLKGALGRAFPFEGIIEIASELYGYKEKEVLEHELMHIKYPFLSEYEIRKKTKLKLLSLGIIPSFH